jgi:hypothetical protein
MLRALAESFLRQRFAWLFASLLATLGVDPVLTALGFRGRGLDWLLALSLLTVVAGTWRRSALASPVGITTVLLLWLASYAVDVEPGPAVRQALLAAAALWSVGAILPSVLRGGVVDSERIAAALSTYLLVGFAFGGIFAMTNSLAPGSIGGAVSGAEGTSLGDSVYFSFATLATLGYGDVLPVSQAARALAVLEAVIGQLYLAVLVARLVSLYSREQ